LIGTSKAEYSPEDEGWMAVPKKMFNLCCNKKATASQPARLPFCMKAHLFESFAEMIANVPVKGILRAIELEHWMLEDDLLRKRISSLEEAVSILSFCQFVKAVSEGENIFAAEIPAQHRMFFRNIISKLVMAGELPADAKYKFDLTFFPHSAEMLVA
jgi:hypothetical protein